MKVPEKVYKHIKTGNIERDIENYYKDYYIEIPNEEVEYTADPLRCNIVRYYNTAYIGNVTISQKQLLRLLVLAKRDKEGNIRFKAKYIHRKTCMTITEYWNGKKMIKL